jgi:hypothetical protein
MKRQLQALAAIAAISIALPAVAQEATPAKPKTLGREAHLLLSVSGTIVDIDQDTREVTLKDKQGRTETMVVSKSVKRLDEAKVGDKIVLEYYVGFGAEVRKPTAEEEKNPLVVLDAAGKAPQDESPAAGAVRRIRAVVTIEGLDRPTQSITVKGPRGKYFTARVADPSRLEQARIGDKIVLTFTEATVVSLEKAKEGA